MKNLYLIGQRARYIEELQGILRDLNRKSGVPVDNLFTADETMPPGVVALETLYGSEDSFILCPSSPGIRHDISLQLKAYLLKPEPALVHPSASLDPTVLVDEGSTINRLVSIGSHTNVGKHVQINRSASIGHDCCLESFVTVGPGVTIASGVTLNGGAFVGAGAVLLPGIDVGANAIVGAGSVVTKSVPEFATVVGSPSSVIGVGDKGYRGFTVPS